MKRLLDSLFRSLRKQPNELQRFDVYCGSVHAQYRRWLEQLWHEYDTISWQDHEARARASRRYQRLTKRYGSISSRLLRKKQELVGQRVAKVEHIELS